MRQSPKYKIYPSLLDKFQQYLDLDYENYWVCDNDGKWHRNFNASTGEFLLSYEDVEERARQELISAINREPIEVSEAACKGTAFNEIVDCIIMNKPCKRDDIKIKSQDFFANGSKQVAYPCIKADIDGFTFYFDRKLCVDAANYFKGSLCQQYVSGTLDTQYGNVLLYGYIDYLRENKVFDAKTTKQYEFGKFSKSWQKHVYPYTLIESGKCTDINTFEYTVFQLTGGKSDYPLINGSMYKEEYVYDHKQSEDRLRNICEHFIEFLEENKDSITDKKIFGNG